MTDSRIPDAFPTSLPLVGRKGEIRQLLGHLRAGPEAASGLLVLHGPGGVGKTRLTEVLQAEARRRGWTRLRGQAFPPESGVPYATLSDAFLPLLRDMSPERLAVLTRGGSSELAVLFPALDAPDLAAEMPPHAGEPEEFRMRLFWTFTEFLGRLASRDPVLVVLEDLQWADASSLELLHFAIRNPPDAPVRFVGTYADEFVEEDSKLRQTLASLSSNALVRRIPVEPFSSPETRTFVSELFDVPEKAVGGFSGRIHEWTRGNTFFLVETLRSLVESGSLHRHQGSWLGWESEEREIPGSVRDVVIGRIARRSPLARELARRAAVAGDRISFSLLVELSDADQREVLEALEELCGRGILEEREEDGAVVYRFTHPLLRECVYEDLGLARTRTLHRAMADALERDAETAEDGRVEELAYHFLRSGGAESGVRAVPYLVAAGRRALDRHADEEAVDCLEKAWSVRSKLEEENGGEVEEARDAGSGPTGTGMPRRATVLRLLGRALQRRGRYEEALDLWKDLLEEREVRESPDRVADVHRRMALASFWKGRYAEALSHFETGLGTEDVSTSVRARIRLGYGVCLQEIARWDRAREAVNRALEEAEAVEALHLRAAAHRTLALLHTWRGPPEEVRHHGSRAIELAREAGDRHVAFWGHWALAVHEGLTGHLDRMDEEVAAAREIVDELRLPVLRLWTDEIRIEKAYVTGEWDAGLALGERAISLARSLEQRILLPRLLVWTALIHLGRDDVERGRELVDEAWEIAYGEMGERSGGGPGGGGSDGDDGDDGDDDGGGGGAVETPGRDAGLNVHAAIPAHIGRVAYLLAVGEEEEAVRMGEKGLALADESGYALWGIHRLLPLMGEAYVLLRDLDGAREISDRMREDSERMGHELGLAWADAADALITWLEGDPSEGADQMRRAVERLEAIPWVPDAARVRRQLAGRLADLGDRSGALEELRKAHEIFARIGAERELKHVRIQFKELESRPPARSGGAGAGKLTGREMEVARLVAERNSNKAVAKRLGISPRTVGTHLSNIYRKIDAGSREELADMVREGRIALGGDEEGE